jgi:hypothetical protein
VKVGDLVRYVHDKELGIITALDNSRPSGCYVVWFTCDNKGWWNTKNLEVINENR